MNARLRAVRLAPLWLAACLLATAISTDTHAQAPGRDSARIGAVGRASDGRAALNQAAGTGNAQANLAAIATAPDGLALTATRARQRVDFDPGAAQRAASTRIETHAFADHAGLLQLNQSAGAGNAQLNAFDLARGASTATIAGLDDSALANVAADTAAIAPTQAAHAPREALIADDAFRGGQGVLQLNQTAGTGNASVNAIVLRLPGGVP
ncbi:hypothetical protein [Pseudomonas sp. CGJS7]|uniref:hypothetical protein n=1 Tax=Pseudomonas sp. CGJS7 TaxID=3109348 RepID=UPI00300BF5D0